MAFNKKWKDKKRIWHFWHSDIKNQNLKILSYLIFLCFKFKKIIYLYFQIKIIEVWFIFKFRILIFDWHFRSTYYCPLISAKLIIKQSKLQLVITIHNRKSSATTNPFLDCTEQVIEILNLVKIYMLLMIVIYKHFLPNFWGHSIWSHSTWCHSTWDFSFRDNAPIWQCKYFLFIF